MTTKETEERSLFVRHVTVQEQKDDDGTLLGDRITVEINRHGPAWSGVRLLREDKLVHGEKVDGGDDWDWQVDPDAGLCMTLSQAEELHDALSEGLGYPTREDRLTLADGEKYLKRIHDGTKALLAEQTVMLARALKKCATDSFHDDLCGVCHHHLVDCDRTMVLDDYPPSEANARHACPGAEARIILKTNQFIKDVFG